MRRAAGLALLAFTALATGTALACGEVPTLPGGIAFITPIILPSPAVAYGDTLRDSTGRVVPVSVLALGRNGDTIDGLSRTFIITSLRSGARINASGLLIAPDSLTQVRFVAQVRVNAGDSEGLQTPEITLDVVPRADAISRTSFDTARRSLPLRDSLGVNVSGLGPAAVRGAVRGIIVRYRITTVFPATATRTLYYLADELSGAVIRPDSSRAVDTTDVSGNAVRALVALQATASGEIDADSLVVEASARALAAPPRDTLNGSPVRFVIRFRKS